MKKIGIIVEYSPFHNGHIYQIKKIKEMYPDSLIIIVMSGNFTERGIPSIIDKWDKCEIALKYGIDLVIELPFVFATQSADIFAKGAISILKELKVDYLVFGSESNDIKMLENYADISLSKDYNNEVKNNNKSKDNYPTILNKAFKKFNLDGIKDANDLLGLSYIKEIKRQKASIIPISIERTNDYHSLNLDTISSATSIRNAIINKQNIDKTIPKETKNKLNKNIYLTEDYFKLLKYKILTSDDLDIYQTVPNKFTDKIKKEAINSNSWEELVIKLKSRNYTYNRINRMLLHILCNFTKDNANSFKDIEYIRVLGMSKNGKSYLNKIKKEVNIPIITTFSKGNSKMLEYEKTTSNVYYSIKDNNSNLLKKEYSEKLKLKEDV